jgi:hypothetical protein
MARVSTWGDIREDTIARVETLRATSDPNQSWRHVPDSKTKLGAGRDRTFTTTTEYAEDPPRVFGAGEMQLDATLVLEVRYMVGPDIDDKIAADHIDLVEALQPRSTYPARLHVRSVGLPAKDEPDNNTVTVRFPVRHIYRASVALTG